MVTGRAAAGHRIALARFVAREAETQEVLTWCVDPAGPALRMLAGPGGVGKSRLAAEIARELPRPWATGRAVTDRIHEVWEAVLACGDPTLIVVDDADTEPGVESLVRQVVARQGGQQQVKLLVVVRDSEAFGTWLRKQLPDEFALRWRVTSLQVVGGAGDRRRWFVQAARAYAAALKYSKSSPVPLVAVGVYATQPRGLRQIQAAQAVTGGDRGQGVTPGVWSEDLSVRAHEPAAGEIEDPYGVVGRANPG